MKRLFLEIDSTTEGLHTNLSLHEIEWKFDKIITDCASSRETWNAIKEADEIYFMSSLINSYFSVGSGHLFNAMMARAIEEGVSNKKVFIMHEYSGMQWGNLKSDLLDKAFRKNYLYIQVCSEEEREGYNGLISVYKFEQVDIDKLLREEF